MRFFRPAGISIFIVILCLSLIGCSSNTSNSSQDSSEKANIKFPTRPVNLLVQYPAGGGVDITARITAKYAEKYLGERIVVQNIAGGSGVVGVTKVATSKPDGYTLGIAIPAIISDKSL